MSEYILKTTNLTKTYKGYNAVNNVSITLEPGKIYGLIGRNGAGKSTFMRLIAGLSYPNEGKIELFGHTKENEIQLERRRMGCMIEAPSINLSMTAKENMRLHRIIRGIPNEEIEDELLSLLDIADTGKKKVKNFSLGMKQRLGIAITLLNNPEFLILDEHCNHYLLLQSTDICKLVNVIEQKLNTTNYKVMPDNSVQLFDYIDDKEFVGKTLFENEVAITNLSNEGGTLEDYFVSMVGGIENV